MAFPRPTLTQLRARVASDVASAFPGADALLRFSNLGVLAQGQAGLAHGHYGYLDWIARQAVPFTATDEYLEGWAALKGVIRKPKTAAIGAATFATVSGSSVPAGTALSRSDGAGYVTTADVTATGASITVPIAATTLGVIGNADAGTTLIFETGLVGVQSTGALSGAATGGADLESDDELRSRMLLAYANPPQGGSQDDFVGWALAVPGVTRCWVRPAGMGAGTIVLYFMLDDAEEGHQGFPQGTNGVATAETRDTPAAGDQLALANAIHQKQPVTALVYAVAPTPNPVAMTITGLAGASSTLKAAISTAFAAALLRNAVPGGVTNLSAIEAAIAGVSGSAGFVITSVSCPAGTVSPGSSGNITSAPGALPVPGVITWA